MKYKERLIERHDSDPEFELNRPDFKWVPVLYNHNQNQPIGKALIYWDGYLYADFELNKEYKGLYPSIGYTVLSESEKGRHIKIYNIGLSETANEDSEIPPL